MLRRFLTFLLAFWVSFAPFFNELLKPALAAPVVLPPSISNNLIPAGVATKLDVTCRIITGRGDPALLANGIKLLRVDSSDRVLAVFGTMKGAKFHGARGVYTLRITVNETVPGDLRLKCSAAFRGLPDPILSPTVVVPIVSPTNRPPLFTSTPPTVATETVAYSYQATAQDPEGSGVTFQLLSGPSGMTMSQSGLVHWTPTHAQIGAQDVQIKATDSQNASSTQSFTIQVAALNQPPAFTSTPVTAAIVNVPYSYQAAAQDPESGALSFSVASGPSGLTIGQTTGLVQWTPSQAQAGDNAVTLRVADPLLATGDQSFTIRVGAASANQPPAFTSTPVTTATETVAYTYQAAAQDPEGGALTFSVVSGPSGLTIGQTSGLVQWTPTHAQVGDQSVQLKVTDPLGAAGNQNFTIKVAELNLAPIITSVPQRYAKTTEDYAYDVTAFDPEKQAVAFSFATPQPAGMTLDSATGALRWRAAANQVGTHSISIRATDTKGASDTQTFTLTAFDPANDLQILSPSGPLNASVGQSLVAPLQANYTGALFAVEPLPKNASVTGGNFNFKPAGDQEGVQTVVVRAAYGDMQKSVIVPITVTRDNTAPVIGSIPSQSVQEGQSLNFTVSATDAENDALTYSAPGLNIPNAFFNTFTHQFTFNPALGQAGKYQVTFFVSDTRSTSQTTVSIQVTPGQGQQQALDLAVDPPPNPTFQSSLTISGSITGQTAPPPTQGLALITGLSPSSSKQGQTKTIQITGLNTKFAQGTSKADFGDGVKVNSLTVNSPTSAQADITVDKLAQLGVRTVKIIGAGNEVPSVVGFSVEKGAASVSGVVIDPFTQQPIAGARVAIEGTNIFVLTDSQGRFTLNDVPAGSVPLLITLPNFEVRRLGLAIGPNDAVTLAAPIQLNALVRPPVFAGLLPRAATVASVIDRGVGGKGGGLTLEQAKAVISDTMIAVGGIQAGVLDEGGNQLNPKITGSGELSLTQKGVERQALALIQGDVYTLREFVGMLQETFSFPIGLSLKDVVIGFQNAANQAWANPADPLSSMAIVLFNEGTTLSSRPPVITGDTRFNRFQLYLLASSFLVLNAANGLERGIEATLDANGVDWKSQFQAVGIPVARAPSAEESRFAVLDWMGRALTAVKEWLLPSAYADNCPPNPAFPCTPGDLLQRKTFIRVWTAVGSSTISDMVKAAVFGAVIAGAQATFLAVTLGVTNGAPGVVIGLAIGAGAMSGAVSTLIFKLVLMRMLAQAAASLDPAPVGTQDSFRRPDGSFVIRFSRSETEQQDTAQHGADKVRFFTYHLYRFPDCSDGDWRNGRYMGLAAKPDFTDLNNRKENPTGRLKFVIPPSKLSPGPNCFRIVTFQVIGNSELNLAETFTPYDTDVDGKLSPEEFTKAGFGADFSFNGFDKNQDGKLDETEFKPKSRVPQDLNYPSNKVTPYLQARGHIVNTSPAEVEQGVATQRSAIEQQLVGDVNQARSKVNALYANRPAPGLELVESNVSAFQLSESVNQRAMALAGETAHLTDAEAAARFDAEAPALAKQVFNENLGIDPDATHVEHVKNVLQANRNAGALRERFNTLFGEHRAMDEAIRGVKAGNTASAKVTITTEFESNLPGDFSPLDQETFSAKPVQSEEITITPGNVDDVEFQFRKPSQALIGNNGQHTPITKNYFWGRITLGRLNDPNGVGDTEVADVGGKNIASTEHDLLTDAVYTKKFLNGETNITLDDISEQLDGTDYRNDVKQKGFEAAANAREMKAAQADLDKVNTELQKFRTQRNIKEGELFRSELAPKIAKPDGLTKYFEKGVTAPVQFLGAFLTVGSELANFLHYVKILSSVPSDCYTVVHAGVPLPTEQFPPGIEPSPDGFELTSVFREQKDPNNPKGGFIVRDYPGDDETSTPAEAGFPPGGLTIGDIGELYAINMNSTERFGGRIFRYTLTPTTPGPPDAPQPFGFAREMVGAINYYSLDLQFAKPALPVAMVAGPKYSTVDKFGLNSFTRDLFVADIDINTSTKRILTIPISRLDTTHTYDNGVNRHRVAGEPLIVSDQFQFTGPSDMEVGPDLAFADGRRSADSVILLSDENVIWAILRNGPGLPYTAKKIFDVPGRRFSGLAFDALGKFYFADYLTKEIFFMDWAHLRVIINSSGAAPAIQTDNDIHNNAFLMARTPDNPGDVEVEGPSSHPGGVLFYSRLVGDAVPIMMPLMGKVGSNVREIKIKRLSKEDDVAIENTPAGVRIFRAEPTHEDLNQRKMVLTVKRIDGQGNATWREQTAFLADSGATILDIP